MKSIKKVSYMLVFLFAFVMLFNSFGLSAKAADIETQTSKFYVNDLADVFSEEQNEALVKKAADFADEHDGVQVVISTITSLGDYDIKEYANKMYNQYQIGRDDKGILILFARDDRKVRIEVGKGLEDVITDSKSGRMLDSYAIPKFKQEEYAEGLTSLQEAVLNEISMASLSENEKNIVTNSANVGNKDFFQVASTIVGIIIFFIILAIFIDLIYENKKFKKTIESFPDDLEKKDDEIDLEKRKNSSLNEQIKELNGKVHRLNVTINEYEVQFERAKKIHPNLEAEIEEVKEKEKIEEEKKEACAFSDRVEASLNGNVTKEMYSSYKNLLGEYTSFSKRKASFVTANMSDLSLAYKEAENLLNEDDKRIAKNLNSTIQSDLNGINPISHYSVCIRKCKYYISKYDALTSNQQNFCNKQIIEEVNEMYRKAQSEKRRIEEEEERERRLQREAEERRNLNSSNNSSSGWNGDSDGFNGFGGSSGGGGSDRGW